MLGSVDSAGHFDARTWTEFTRLVCSLRDAAAASLASSRHHCLQLPTRHFRHVRHAPVWMGTLLSSPRSLRFPVSHRDGTPDSQGSGRTKGG